MVVVVAGCVVDVRPTVWSLLIVVSYLVLILLCPPLWRLTSVTVTDSSTLLGTLAGGNAGGKAEFLTLLAEFLLSGSTPLSV